MSIDSSLNTFGRYGNYKKTSKKKGVNTKNYVTVSNPTYGKALRGTRIYWEGKRPASLNDDGRINLGKNILEMLGKHFPKFHLIITTDTNSITTERGITRVRISQQLLSRMGREVFERNRDIKNDIIRKFLAIHFTDHFKEESTPVYVPGTVAKILNPNIITRLSSQDKDALNAFLPDYISSESMGSVHTLNAKAQIKTLKGLAEDLEREIPREHPESWWQTYVKSNILLMQQGYIKAVEKLNTAIGNTRFPDFLLVTHDNYLDILEIKKPNTPILKPDASRGNFYFDAEISKAVIQTENYIQNVAKHQDTVRAYLKDHHNIEIRAVRPRGIVLAGNSRNFNTAKERDDFRLLSQGIKNITIVTYDELLVRLQNYIAVLEEFSKKTL